MIKGTCKHFRGRDGCALGIDIRALVGGPDWGWGRRKPCNAETMRATSLPPINPAPCDQYEEPTAQEVAESEARMQRAEDAMMAVVVQGRTDVPCPECGETLGAAGCPAGCVSWHICRRAGEP